MIVSNSLQPLPGSSGMRLYPFIRKIDLMSSNSYILFGDEQIAVIDPGALDDQLDCLVENIVSVYNEKPRPVVVYLTHTHLDHCFLLSRMKKTKGIGYILIAAHEAGVDALEGRDTNLTLSRLLGRKLDPVLVDIRLLSKKDIPAGGKVKLEKEGIWFCSFIDSFKIRYGPVMYRQIVSMGGGDNLEIYSIPGHSPDSICLKAGSLLFTGDFFFAPNPGMAGAYGWDQANLLKSIYKVMWILENKDIAFCCSGHGKVIDSQKAWASLRSMYHDVVSLSNLEEITIQWAKSTALYAEDLMTEMDRLFTIIIGRLTYISHVLEELEEDKEAKSLQSIININQIDELFMDFNRFVREHDRGMKLDWDLVHKAGQIIRLLDRLLESRSLDLVLDKSLMRRANRMLDDYTSIYRGFRPAYYADEVNIKDLLETILESLDSKPYDDQAILRADRHEDFIGALEERLNYINIFNNISFTLIIESGLPLVRMDRERFVDGLSDLLERITATGAREIKLGAFANEGWVSIHITADGSAHEHTLDQRAWRFFERLFALGGGLIQKIGAGDELKIEIEFLSSES